MSAKKKNGKGDDLADDTAAGPAPDEAVGEPKDADDCTCTETEQAGRTMPCPSCKALGVRAWRGAGVKPTA